ncbi:MAG: hypothetical protein M5U26_14415 [Planctomycetota bacterium]|nr:hypothetical protein [Planctomycetota bacterium]
MSLRAGFAEIEITPPIGTHKIGWLKVITPARVRDPLFARVAVLESAGSPLAFVQLDTLSVRWTTANEIRTRVRERYGFPPERILVAATHNHGGPAVACAGVVPRDDAYLATLVEKVISAFGQALEAREPAELGLGRGVNFGVGNNRRVIMRDGTVKTHGTFKDPGALCLEGPLDPELVAVGLRRPGGAWLGALVNYALHPTHFGGEDVFTAGWPGAMANALKARGVPFTLFLNGAFGNMSHSDPAQPGRAFGMEEVGGALAETAWQALQGAAFEAEPAFAARAVTLRLPYREPSAEQVLGTARGAQRFIDSKLYDREMPKLVERIRARGAQPAELLAFDLGPLSLVTLPCEAFVELGLRIKEAAHPRRAIVVGAANGMIGYVPTRQAFERGGYETTFIASSRMAPETGDLLVEAAVKLLRA